MVIKIPKRKPAPVMVLKDDVREAVAIFLYGPDYTPEQLKAVAVFENGRWYKYKQWGTYHVNVFGRIVVEVDS
jgi:hypothetical protein